VNAKSPERGLQTFIYKLYHIHIYLFPKSSNALGNTRIRNQLTEVSLHISTVQ